MTGPWLWQVVIKYVPYVGDSKRALDEYTSEIMMGGTNTIVIHNTCEVGAGSSGCPRGVPSVPGWLLTPSLPAGLAAGQPHHPGPGHPDGAVPAHHLLHRGRPRVPGLPQHPVHPGLPLQGPPGARGHPRGQRPLPPAQLHREHPEVRPRPRATKCHQVPPPCCPHRPAGGPSVGYPGGLSAHRGVAKSRGAWRTRLGVPRAGGWVPVVSPVGSSMCWWVISAPGGAQD